MHNQGVDYCESNDPPWLGASGNPGILILAAPAGLATSKPANAHPRESVTLFHLFIRPFTFASSYGCYGFMAERPESRGLFTTFQ
ncbi:unnamed protein product [Protopolystoma xenopodis]|uniref:Uncharacterized protein n=1 Tax=Protopolystoma xenopodis TaxID=117903 RepID=A0A3S5ARV8_9PLAT|nr:unnamed protein product [Protopolystoma xenopodis]